MGKMEEIEARLAAKMAEIDKKRIIKNPFPGRPPQDDDQALLHRK